MVLKAQPSFPDTARAPDQLTALKGAFIKADVRIGSPSEGATRGVIAERRFCPNEVLLSLPQHLTIPFEGTPEEAVVLLLYIKHQKALSKRFQPWLDALPGPDDFIAWDCLDDEALTLLQCRGMEDAVKERRAWLEAVWQCEGQQDVAYSRQEMLSSLDITWDEVQWAANVVRSRNWKVGQAASGASSSVMLPLMDMLNHDRESPNRMRFNDGAFQLVHEGDGIEAGEEITYSYEGHAHELRNDQAALDYCFMLPLQDDRRLFHIDALASSTQGEQEGLQDMSRSELREEYARMESIVEGFPTTLMEDKDLMLGAEDGAGANSADEQFLVQIRIARKAALEDYMKGIRSRLASANS